MSNKFNLVEEPWIPVIDHPRVSLGYLFREPSLKAISGNAIQKLALLKLMLAIAQRACTPKDDQEWMAIGSSGVARRCAEYVEQHKECFWLYGDRPFLQKPELLIKKTKSGEPLPVSRLGRDYIPDLVADNDTILYESQQLQPLTDAEKAVFIVTLMNFGFSGKRIARDVPAWTPGHPEKSNSARSAPSMSNYEGYLLSYLLGESIQDTIWLNLFTRKQLDMFLPWRNDELVPPWEEMPAGEKDEIAQRLKESFMATLCAVSRFVLLHDDGIIYAEGLQYPYHKEGWREPFMTFSTEGKILWCDPSKKPWRNLTALLSTVFNGTNSNFECPQIRLLLPRVRMSDRNIGIWSGGLKVRVTAGDMNVKQDDDYIDSKILFRSADLGDPWFASLEIELEELNGIANKLRDAVNGYQRKMGSHKSPIITKALATFWEFCDQHAQTLVFNCDNPEQMLPLRRKFADFAHRTYNTYCPSDSAKQMNAWAQNIPDTFRYISN